MARTFNLGDLFDITANTVPERMAVIWDDVRLSYGELAERSDRLAAAMRRRGLVRGMTMGILMYNCPAYLEALLACFKIGVIPFNINYRYGADELHYILNDAGTDALIYDREFDPLVHAVTGRLPPLRRIVVDDTSKAEDPDNVVWDNEALAYSQALDEPVGDVDLHAGRGDEDRVLLYTGGTTGFPKGVEWSHQAKFFGALRGGVITPDDRPIEAPEQLAARVRGAPSGNLLSLPPLMHGAAMWSSLFSLLTGQTVILVRSKNFDAEQIWGVVAKEKVGMITLTSDAMGKPLVEALEANPGRWDLSSLRAITWGGAAIGISAGCVPAAFSSGMDAEWHGKLREWRDWRRRDHR